MTPDPLPLTVSQVAALWRCGRRTVLRAIARGDLAARLIGDPPGGRWLIDPAALDAWRGPRPRGRHKRLAAPQPSGPAT